MHWIWHIIHWLVQARKISRVGEIQVGRWEDLGVHAVMGVKGPFMGIEVSFDFFHRHLNDFNIVLITGTEVMVAEMEGIFGIGIEFIGNIKNVLIEE
jgi:hypothetical protein